SGAKGPGKTERRSSGFRAGAGGRARRGTVRIGTEASAPRSKSKLNNSRVFGGPAEKGNRPDRKKHGRFHCPEDASAIVAQRIARGRDCTPGSEKSGHAGKVNRKHPPERG